MKKHFKNAKEINLEKKSMRDDSLEKSKEMKKIMIAKEKNPGNNFYMDK